MSFLDDLRAAKADLDRQLAESLTYYTPKHLRPLVGLIAEANPVVSMERAGTASRAMLAPNATPAQRVGYAGDMLSNMAGVVAPSMVAGRAGIPAATAIQEGLTGIAATARLPEFAMDESGALRLFHGSPHDFDRFSMDKIGTGEGAQAYGHGLYFAENEAVAKGYRDALSLDAGFSYKGKSGLTRDQIAEEITKDFGGRYLDNVTTPRGVADGVMDELVYGPANRKMGPERAAMREKLLAEIQRTDPGKMYEVEVNANPEDFLDWDKPLSQQPQKVQDFANSRWNQIFGRGPDASIEGEFIAKAASPQSDIDGRSWLETSPAADQAKRLREAGIPGIRYLDAGSREAGGTRNYVVFDENLINIVRKYGIAGAAVALGVSEADVANAMGANTPAYDLDTIDAWMQGR